jgi:hypothetical protein
MKLFLDLEETIIKSWDNSLLCNVNTVKKFIETSSFVEANSANLLPVTIFSFAIWNEKDKLDFVWSMQERIETVLQTKVERVVTVEEIVNSIRRNMKAHLSVHDVVSIWGKHRAFFDWCRFEEECNCRLLDDCVPNLFLVNKDTGFSTETINLFTFAKQ